MERKSSDNTKNVFHVTISEAVTSVKAKELESESESEIIKPSGIFGIRHLQCFLLFCCLTVAYALRVNLSVGIVAMTNRNSTRNPDFEEYHWNGLVQSYIQSSFFWGYVVTQIPAGHLAQRYGAKYMLFFGVLLCSILAILTPICADLGWEFMCSLRVLQGLCQGVIFPSTHTLLSKWSPVEERGRLGTYCYSGSQFGTVVMLASSGVIASSSLGWPSIFYISGVSGIIWSVAWFFFGANNPAEHKTISAEERRFIETSLGHSEETHKKHVTTPWVKIITSMPFLALLIVHCAHNWGFWTLLTQMPLYIAHILKMDIKDNALLSALPYFVMMMLSYCFSYLADVLGRRQSISLSISRKLFNSIGHWIPMIALIGLGYLTKDNINLAIVLLTIAVGINAATYLGFQVNHIDLAPNHAGTLMGITNCAANIMSIIAPLTVGFVVSDQDNPAQWRIVFFISAGIYLIGNLLFVIFGKTDVQIWNSTPELRLNIRRQSAIAEALESHN